MPTSPTLADLQTSYAAKLSQYDSKVAAALATNDASKLPEIRALNLEITTLLDEILTETSKSTDPTSIQIKRDELVAILGRIQQEYNGLSDASDTLERLRRIRENETPRSEFNLYLALFFAVCAGIIGILFFGSQKNIAPNTTAMALPSTASLT
jgi:hypothetical protein